jgi:hypothetical protein
MTWRARIGPALLLVALAPIVAEFLLGDFTIKSLPIAIVLMPLYGCGALLIREIARRTGRGWPTMILLGVAYALAEEGVLTQSLFNPNYVGQRLLDYGYSAALGTSLNWSLFVLSIHVVWSVATPILIAEGIAADRRTQPWLKRVGLVITTLLFILGCVTTARFSLQQSPFVASRLQFVATGVLVLLAIGAAFAFRPHVKDDVETHAAPKSWWVAVFAWLTSMVFVAAEPFARGRGMPAFVPLLSRLACEIVAIVLIARWSRRHGWGPMHYLAIATGTVITYALLGLTAFSQGHTNLGAPTDRIDIAGQIGLTLVILSLIAWAARRSADQRTGSPDGAYSRIKLRSE